MLWVQRCAPTHESQTLCQQVGSMRSVEARLLHDIEALRCVVPMEHQARLG